MKFYIASSIYLSLVFADFGDSGGVTFYKLTALSRARVTEYLVDELVCGDMA